MNRFYAIVIACLFLTQYAVAQAPTKVWDKTLGGTGSDVARAVVVTSDGGVALMGYTESGAGGDKTEASRGSHDYWVVKLNSSGQKVWDKTLGGSESDYGHAITATNDGGVVVAGQSVSGAGGDKTEASRGSSDCWVVKLNSSGQKVWDKTLGGSDDDAAFAITTTNDGGVVIAGRSASGVGGDKTEASRGSYDYWVVKLNSSGQKVWDRALGGSESDYGYAITATGDGGIVITGNSTSGIGGDKTEAHRGGSDYWVVKLNSSGQKVWDKTLGGNGNDYGNAITATNDGGVVIAGWSGSGAGGDKTEASRGGSDYWVVKLNSSGQKVWDKTLGGSANDYGYTIAATGDGGFVVAGYSSSGADGDKTEASRGYDDFWVVKLNSSGQKAWDKRLGASWYEQAYAITTLSDGGAVIAGFSSSGAGGDKTDAGQGEADYWAVKLAGVSSTICATPTSLTETEMTGTQIRLNWQPVLGANSYSLQYREVGTTNWTTSTPSGGSTFWYVSAQYGKTYEWQIRTNCTAVSSNFSPLRTFTVVCPVPFGQLELTGPTAANLQWRYMSMPNGSSLNYNLQWRAVGAANWTTASNVCCSTYNLNNLTAGQAYEWRIQTICPEGGTTAYTAPRSFTAGCGTPGYIGYYTITSTMLNLGWQMFPGVTYELRWRPSGNTNTPFTTATGITGVPYSLTGLTNNTTYEVQTRAVCSPTESSGWSSSSFHTTNCQTPWTNSPVVYPSSASLSFGAAGGGTQYRLIWQTVGSPTSTTINGITTSPYTLTGLTPGTAYQYQMQTLCSDGNVSGLSSVRSFTTGICAAPTSLTETEMTTSQIRLGWQAVSGVNGYTLRFREVSTLNWSTLSYGAATTGVYISTIYGKTYEWQVSTNCPSGPSDYSPLRTFTMTCPVPFGLSEQIGPVAVNLQWRYMTLPNSSSSFTYNLQWRAVGAANWTTASTVCCQSYYLSNLTTGQAYEWRMQSICPGGSITAYTAPRSFTAGCGTPGAPYFHAMTSTTIRLGWPTFSGMTYELRWRPSGNVNTPFTTVTGITSVPYNLTGLTNSTNYEVQVRAVCSPTESSGWSSSSFYTTQCLQTYNYLPTASFNSATLNFEASGGGTQYRVILQTVGSPTSTTINGITTSPYTLTGLNPGTAYQYQMQTLCSDGNTSGLGQMQSFTTLTCTAPTGLTEVSVDYGSAQLRWNVVPGQYRVRWRTVGDLTWSVGQDINNNSTGTYMYWIYSLLSGLSYEWQVERVCSPTQSVTATRQFTVPCLTPSQFYAAQAAGTSAQVSWAGSWGDVFQVRWRTTGAANWTEGNPITSSAYLLTNLIAGQSYEYQVQQICEGVATGYSASQTFTTGCNPPGGLSAYSISSRGVSLGWSGFWGVGTLYEVQYRPVGAGSWTSVPNLIQPYTQLTNLTSSTAYEWQVRMLCTDGNSSAFSAPSTFTTTACNAPTFTNESAILPDRADLQIGTRAGEVYRVEWRQVGSATWANSFTFTSGLWPISIQGLTSGVSYEWRVQTVCDASTTSPFTTPRTFTTGCFPPTGLYTGTPSQTYQWISWNGNPAYSYQVRWKRQIDPAWTVENPVAQNTFSFTALTPNTAYEWQVQLICSGTGSGYSVSQTFTTAVGGANCDTPGSISAWPVSAQEARIRWSSVASTQTEVQWRPAGVTGWPNSFTFSGATTFINLTTLQPNTGYQLRARTLCIDGSTSAYVTSWFTTRAVGGPVYTVIPGLWFTNAIWSYFNSPTLFDSAEIRHEVVMPGTNVSTKQIRLTPGGKLIFSTGSQIKLGF
jgi:hypothetical protein